jgi:hypothetical protein
MTSLNKLKNVLMDHYGDKIIDKNNIPYYKLSDDLAMLVKSYVNKDGFKSNQISVKEIKNGELQLNNSDLFI